MPVAQLVQQRARSGQTECVDPAGEGKDNRGESEVMVIEIESRTGVGITHRTKTSDNRFHLV